MSNPTPLDRLPLIGPGSTPGAIATIVLVLIVLWAASTRRSRPRTHLLFVLAAIATGLALWVGVDRVWRPIADGIGPVVWAWTAVLVLVAEEAVAAFRIGSARARGAGSSSDSDATARRRPVLRALGALVSLAVAAAAAGIGINTHFGAYYTLGSALGLGLSADPLSAYGLSADSAREVGGVLDEAWTPPSDLLSSGRIAVADVPPSDSRFRPRAAWGYLPPAAFAQNAPKLPLLVLMAGQPGEPKQWFTAGKLKSSMDAWAAKHGGLAPIILVVDPIASPLRDPLCSDAYLGNVATYIEKDVPAWALKNLPISADRSRWAIGGLSNGGTCALQVVARNAASPVYRTFLALSPEEHPTLGTRARTVARGFGGDEAAYEANDPLSLFTKNRFTGVTGLFAVGDADEAYRPGVERLAEAARAAGIPSTFRTYPGRHSWTVWSAALPGSLDELGARLSLTR